MISKKDDDVEDMDIGIPTKNPMMSQIQMLQVHADADNADDAPDDQGAIDVSVEITDAPVKMQKMHLVTLMKIEEDQGGDTLYTKARRF